MAVYGTILCLGDSLTHGARDDYGRCYPMELSDMLWNEFKQKWVCAEEGVNGETSSDVLRRCVSVFKKYPEAHEVVLLCGTNDSKDKANISTEVFKKNITGILRMAGVYEKEVLLCTIPDLHGFGAPDYSQASQERIDNFNCIILSMKDPVIKGLIDLREIPKDYYADGVHFKNAGHVEIASRVFEGIKKKRQFDKPTNQSTVYSGLHEEIGVFDADGNFIPKNRPNTKCPRDPKLTTPLEKPLV